MNYYTTQNETLILAQKPLGRGGEGSVYEIISPSHYSDQVVKLYHDRERKKSRELKLLYLMANPPRYNPETMVWPQELVYSDPKHTKFVGYLMPKAKSQADLTSLCALHIPDRLGNVWQDKFSRANRSGLMNRIQVCQNIAQAFTLIHQQSNYTFVDIKPENIKVDIGGQVTILDIDSLAVSQGDHLMFPAEKSSLEYSPAEIQYLNPNQDPIHETWDRFSLALVFYKILCGLHPFTGTCYPPHHKRETYAQKIQAGLFPLGKNAALFRVVPEPHQAFHHLPLELRNLFQRCFDEGFENPDLRPSAEEWALAFDRSESFLPIPYFHRKPKTSVFPSSSSFLPKSKDRAKQWLPATLGGFSLVGLSLFLTLQFTSYQIPEESLVRPKIEKLAPETVQKINRNTLGKKFDYVEKFHEGLAKVKKDGKYTFVNAQGQAITQDQFTWAGNFKEGMARVSKDRKFGFLDENGQEKIPLHYDWVGDFNQGLAKVRLNGLTGYVNEQNQTIVPFRYDYGDNFVNGLARVKKNGLWGYINPKGQEIIPTRYVESRNFHEGLAAVRVENKWGYINTQNQMVISPQFTWASGFIKGEAMVHKNGKQFFINLKGESINK